jgi:hypothetical protein
VTIAQFLLRSHFNVEKLFLALKFALYRLTIVLAVNDPTNIAAINSRTCVLPVKRLATAGPGHTPSKPHPIPNSAAPPTNFLSIALEVGQTISSPNTDSLLGFINKR